MFRSRPPQKDRRGRFWDWINPDVGKSRNAWLIGELVGVETHWMGRTQPCRWSITGGKLKCFCHTSNLGREWKGYVPLLDENGVQCFAIVGERYCDVASSIPLFSPVTVSRLRSAGSPVCVKQAAWTENPPPSHGGKLQAKDIRPWLLKLWGDSTLIEWFNSHADEAPASDARPLDPDQFSPMLRGAAKRANVVKPVPATLDDALAEVHKRNGKVPH